MNCLGKPIGSYDTSELEHILKALQKAEARRDEASKHEKFDIANNKKAMVFPPPNPEFLKLKTAIEKEIASRNKTNV